TGHGKLTAYSVWSDTWAPLDLTADGPVAQVRISGNGLFAAAASAQGRVYRLDLGGSRKIAPIGDVREALRSIDIAADGGQIFALGASGHLHLWSQASNAFTDPVPAASITVMN